MSKVDVGDLEKILAGQPEFTHDLVLGKALVINKAVNLGDYQSVVVFGGDEQVEMVFKKDTLKQFCTDMLEHLG